MEKKDIKNFGYDLSLIIKTFGIEVQESNNMLESWLVSQYDLDAFEQKYFDDLYSDAREDGGYWNEEELKINFVGAAFRLARINTKNRIKVFYERPLSGVVKGHSLSVVADCLVATPLPFNSTDYPYFFFSNNLIEKNKSNPKPKCSWQC